MSFDNLNVFYHYIFIISQLWLTSHPRSTVVLLDKGTPGTSRETYSEDADDGTVLSSQDLSTNNIPNGFCTVNGQKNNSQFPDHKKSNEKGPIHFWSAFL